MKLWSDETDAIVSSNWGKSIIEIADMINDHQAALAKKNGWSGWLWCGIGSVAHRAAALGIITSDEAKRVTREARKREKISDDVRGRIIERDGNKCLACGGTDNLQIDHIVPVRLGGKNDFNNLQTLCISCNSKKNLSTADYREFVPQATIAKIGRNDKCPCSSGKKYKLCCMRKIATMQNRY